MKRNLGKWVAGISALAFLLTSLALPAMAAPQKGGQSAQIATSANHAQSSASIGGSSAIAVSKLPSVAPPLPVSVAKSGGLVFAGDPTLPSQFNLNLSSVTAAYSANVSSPAQIYVGGILSGTGRVRGGTAETITPGELLTPAQYVALGQVTATGHQSLVLTANGAASSGFLTLSPGEVSGLSGLYVPAGVSLNSIGFTQASPLAVAGASTVNGSLYAFELSRGVTAQLDFGSLVVGSGGLITSSLPQNRALFSNVFAGNGLTINVSGDLHNSGTISSSGTLSLAAGGGIYNQASSASMTGQTVNLYADAGTFANAGIIAASSGNVNFADQANADINFNNAGGTVSALAGSINFRDASYTGPANLSINGGNLLAQTLNLYSGQGNIDVNSDTVQGVVNVYGGSAHVLASTNDLQLGTIDVSGDPLFYNQQVSGVGGDVTIQSDLTYNGQNLAIVAGGNIVVTGTATSLQIDTSGTATSQNDGGNVYLVAGANLGNCSPCISVDPLPPNGKAPSGTSITVTGASTTGGSIDLTNVSSINTSGYASSGVNSNGGSVTLVAFAGSGTNSGTVNVSGTTITTSGNGTGTNGSVLVIAGAASGTAITLGAINASGGTGRLEGTGNVSIYTAQPTTSDTNPLMFDYTGTITSGNTFVASSQSQPSALLLTNDISARNQASLSAGSISSDCTVSGATVYLQSTSGDIGTSGNPLSVNAGQVLTVASFGNAYVTQTGSNNIALYNSFAGASSAFQLTLNGGTVSLMSTATIPLLSAGTVFISALNGGINIGSVQVMGTTSVTMMTMNADLTSGASGLISSYDVTLNACEANLGTGTATPVYVQSTHSLSAQSDDNAYISHIGSVNLTNSSAGASNTFNLVTTNSGNIAISGGLSGQTVSLTAGGSGSISEASGTIAASTVTLSSTTGSIGSDPTAPSGARLEIAAGTLTVSTGGSGVVFIDNAGSVILDASTAGAAFNVQTKPGSNGGFTLSGGITAPSITLSADGMGDFKQDSGTLSATTVTLLSGSGPIGSSGGGQIQIAGCTLCTLSASTSSSVYISSGQSVTLLPSNGGRNFYLTVNSGNLTLNGNVNPATGGVSGNVQLSATNGDIITPVSGNITVSGNNVILNSGNGNIANRTSTLNVRYFTSAVPAEASLPQININLVRLPSPTPPVEKTTVVEDETIVTDHTDSGSTPGSTAAEQNATKIATDTTPQSAEATALNGTGGNEPVVPAESNSDLNTPIDGISVATGHFDSKTIAELRGSGVDIGEGSNNKFVVLNRGNLLFQPDHDMAVRVQEGTVYIPNGATAFVIETGHDVAVYDMQDGHHGSVKVQVGKKLITLTPGKQLVLTRELASDFNQINPGKRIACRGVRGEVLAEGIKAYAADFSIPSIMMNVAPVKRLLASDTPSERRQAHRLLKNAVILAQMNGQAGPYQSPTAGAPTQP